MGWAIAFLITIVPMITASTLSFEITAASQPASIVFVRRHSSPIHFRHRVNDEASSGKRCWKNVSPQKF